MRIVMLKPKMQVVLCLLWALVMASCGVDSAESVEKISIEDTLTDKQISVLCKKYQNEEMKFLPILAKHIDDECKNGGKPYKYYLIYSDLTYGDVCKYFEFLASRELDSLVSERYDSLMKKREDSIRGLAKGYDAEFDTLKKTDLFDLEFKFANKYSTQLDLSVGIKKKPKEARSAECLVRIKKGDRVVCERENIQFYKEDYDRYNYDASAKKKELKETSVSLRNETEKRERVFEAKEKDSLEIEYRVLSYTNDDDWEWKRRNTEVNKAVRHSGYVMCGEEASVDGNYYFPVVERPNREYIREKIIRERYKRVGEMMGRKGLYYDRSRW